MHTMRGPRTNWAQAVVFVVCGARAILLAAAWIMAASSAAPAAQSAPPDQLEIRLPLGRAAYQTDEWIDLAVVRRSTNPLAAGTLGLQCAGADGSQAAWTFPVAAAPVGSGGSRATEHLHIDARLLRPGLYQIEVRCDGHSARRDIEVYSHVRRSSYRLVNWGRAKGEAQLVEGPDGLGFNTFYGHYADDEQANFLRAGIDMIPCCVMSGGHQMDLRQECDWSDPLVVRGGTWRVVRRALADRTRPNVAGIHFYDEPGLTWGKDAKTGAYTPHAVPSQHRAYRGAFGADPIRYDEVRPDKPEDVARWRHWAVWKLGFMDAAWKDAQFGVFYVRPDFLSLTQTQYGFSAFTDGIYFNAARCLPITSGHGGYDDYGPGYFNPSYTLEMARARDLTKPCWYLPTWYGNTPPERFRLEQYLSFMTNLQGMISPPDIDPFEPDKSVAAAGVVESNRLMARLGTIFTTMPPTRPPVAVLLSLSHNIHVQTRDMKANYLHENAQGRKLPFVYLAGKMLQHQFMTVVDEDIVDGTLAAHHKALVITSVEYLPPAVIAALEQFAAQGGLVLLTGDCKVAIRGAVPLGVVPELPDAAAADRLAKAGNWGEYSAKYATVGKMQQGAEPLARAIRTHLEKAGIRPPLQCDQPGIVVTRQSDGQIEYLFVVNATYDPVVGGLNATRPIEATLSLPDDGRPLYDAVLGGPAKGFAKQGDRLAGRFRFGPGQMRVFARTPAAIGKPAVAAPIVACDFTRAEVPRTIECNAVLADEAGRPLAGVAPLEIRLVDPLGATRYRLFRATQGGALRLSLPLAASDPPGRWTIAVEEQLAGNVGQAAFVVPPMAGCGAMAGATERAVFFAGERDNVFRFFRTHHDVTLVVGAKPFHAAAARRLTESLRPWGIRTTTVAAANVNRPREISAEEAATWVGLEFGRVKAGRDNPVGHAGFDLRGPAVLIGSPDDHPLIDYLHKQRYLPYPVESDVFPGRGRGMIAWQRDGLGPGQESITLIAHDAAGMDEAVGTAFEMASGLEPLTRYRMPETASLRPAAKAEVVSALRIERTLLLPDRAEVIAPAADRWQALTWDGSLVEFDATGRIVARGELTPAEYAQAAQRLKTQFAAAVPAAEKTAALQHARQLAGKTRIVKFVAPRGDRIAIGYWGGIVDLCARDGRRIAAVDLPQDLTGLVWCNDRLVAGLADGRICWLAP